MYSAYGVCSIVFTQSATSHDVCYTRPRGALKLCRVLYTVVYFDPVTLGVLSYSGHRTWVTLHWCASYGACYIVCSALTMLIEWSVL